MRVKHKLDHASLPKVQSRITIDEDSVVQAVLPLHCYFDVVAATQSRQVSMDSHVLFRHLFPDRANHDHPDYYLCRLDHDDHILDWGGNHDRSGAGGGVGKVAFGSSVEDTALHSAEQCWAMVAAGVVAQSGRVAEFVEAKRGSVEVLA